MFQSSQMPSPPALDTENTTPLGRPFPVEEIRARFPALVAEDGFIFFDNAAGAQAPQGVLTAVQRHLLECNVQRGGRYGKSRAVDATIARARESVACLV